MACSRILLTREMLHINVAGKSKTHFIFNSVFPKIVSFIDSVEKYSTAGQATDDIIRRMRL